MNKDELLALRERIVGTLRDAALAGQGTPEDQLQILMGIIRSGSFDQTVAQKAYETAQSLNEDERIPALTDLLYELDGRIAQLNEPPAGDQTTHEE